MIKLNEIKQNTYKIKILDNPQYHQQFKIPLKYVLKKLCGLRTAEKNGDIENINTTQLGKLNDQHVKYEILPMEEEKIATIDKNIDIEVVVDKSIHAGFRQSRDPDFFISDEEIIKIVNKTIPRIAKSLMLNEIDIKDFVHIRNKEDNVNIIGYLSRTGNDNIKFIVVTVMKKENFKVKSKDNKKIHTLNV